MPAFRTGTWIITAMVIVLLVLHQDNWFWDSTTLVGGVVPITLLWHAGISLAAGATWWLATKIAWPAPPRELVQPVQNGNDTTREPS